MSTGTAERVVAKQTESVRIDAEVLARARIAASYAGKQVGQYLADLARPLIDRDIEEGHAKLNKPKPKARP